MADQRVKPLRRQRPPAPPAGFTLDGHIFYLFTQIFGRRNRDLAAKLAPMRITVPKWRILAVLQEWPDSSMNRLAELTTVDRTTLTRTLDQMVRDGLVERREHAEDRRSLRLRLTARGADAFALVLPSVAEQNERAVAGLSVGERAALVALLHRMVRNLDPDYDLRNAAGTTEPAASVTASRRRREK